MGQAPEGGMDVSIVTGGASGIGRATALALGRPGPEGAAPVVVIVDRDEEGARGVAREITEQGGVGEVVVGEVTDRALAEAAVRDVTARHGAPRLLVTAAGISTGGSVLEATDEAWDAVFAVNVKGTLVWMQAVLHSMLPLRRGAIVTIASQLAFAGGRANAAYIASKGAVVSLTRTAALEHARDGIRVNGVAPGATETPLLGRSMARQTDPARAAAWSQSRHAMGRWGRPEEIAEAIVWLGSPAASFVTGVVLPVDGGWLVA